MAITGVVSALLTGLLIGLLGRLAAPGRQPVGCLFTVVIGIVGAVIGAVVARRLGSGPLGTFGLQVFVAAVLVKLASVGTRGRWG